MSTTLDHLVAARALISDPQDWTQGRLAFFDYVDGHLRRCANGALNWVEHASNSYPDGLNSPSTQALVRVLPSSYTLKSSYTLNPAYCSESKVALFNNSHTHAEVLALFDRAIARERLVAGLLEAPVEAKDREPQPA